MSLDFEMEDSDSSLINESLNINPSISDLSYRGEALLTP
jgi:hypothetical protein